MPNRLFVTFAFLVISSFFFTQAPSAQAEYQSASFCNFTPDGSAKGDITISSSCVIYETVNGVAEGNLTLSPGAIVTLNHNLIFAPLKQINIGTDAKIYVNSGSEISQGKMCIRKGATGYPMVIGGSTIDPTTGLETTTSLTQLDMQPAIFEAPDTYTCPAVACTPQITTNCYDFRENYPSLAYVDTTGAGTELGSPDSDLLALGFEINDVNSALAAAGDVVVALPRNLIVNGKIGIAKTDPSVPLDVVGAGTFTGTVTAPTFSGALSGNATTATNLAANGANCTAGSFPLGVTAGGAVESCTDVGTLAPTLTGTGASGSWGISITGDAGTVDGLDVHTARNNLANKIVRTDANGYIQAGYINSTAADNALSSPLYTWGSNGDGYLRTYNTSYLNVATAKNLSTTRANWSTNGVITAVVGEISWKNYGNNHTIFDASNSTAPNGTAVGNTDSAIAWTATFPTLMGWNGTYTYGVRVDRARLADSSTNADTTDGFHLDQNVLTTSNPTFGTIYTSNWFRSTGRTGWYNGDYGVGMRATVAGRVDLYPAGADLYVPGNLGVGITNPAYKVQIVGTFYAGGSSREYKKNISPLTLDSSKIYSLNPVSYDYKDQYKDLGKVLSGGRQFGLIAEDVYKVYPELTLSDGTKNVANVDYEKLPVLLLAEMKKQKAKIDNMEVENNLLKIKINSLDNRLKKLELNAPR